MSSFATASGESAEVETARVYSSFHSATDALSALAATGSHEFLSVPAPGAVGAIYKRQLFAQDYLGTDIA